MWRGLTESILLTTIVLCVTGTKGGLAAPFAGLDGLLEVSGQAAHWSREVSHAKEQVKRLVLPAGGSVYVLLRQFGMDSENIMGALSASKKIATPLSRLAAGTPIEVRWHQDEIQYPTRLSFGLSPFEQLVVERKKGAWKAIRLKADRQVEWVGFSGLITDSFWNSSQEVEMAPQVTVNLAEVFASLIDFSRESRVGDRWRLLVEKVSANGNPVGWGHILAAQFENQGVIYSAVRFEKEGIRRRYFSRDGSSLIRKFLKSPMRFGRITSRFSRRRFHPVLKIRRPHLGIDYGAPVGTPVMAVGDGRVIQRRWRGAGGRTIKIRHSSRYQTAYCHLSRYAKGLKKGDQVTMGQVIGYVGASGRVTGPHLHFEFYKDGRFVDPLSVAFPSADPLPAEYLPELQAVYDKRFAELPPWKEGASKAIAE